MPPASATDDAGQAIDRHTLRLDFSGDDAALSALLAGMIGHGLPVVAFGEDAGDLEDVFMQVTQRAESK